MSQGAAHVRLRVLVNGMHTQVLVQRLFGDLEIGELPADYFVHRTSLSFDVVARHERRHRCGFSSVFRAGGKVSRWSGGLPLGPQGEVGTDHARQMPERSRESLPGAVNPFTRGRQARWSAPSPGPAAAPSPATSGARWRSWRARAGPPAGFSRAFRMPLW